MPPLFLARFMGLSAKDCWNLTRCFPTTVLREEFVWFFLSTPVKNVRDAILAGGADPDPWGDVSGRKRSAWPGFQGLPGRLGPSSRTVPTITTQPTASSHSPWRIMDFRGMQPVP